MRSESYWRAEASQLSALSTALTYRIDLRLTIFGLRFSQRRDQRRPELVTQATIPTGENLVYRH